MPNLNEFTNSTGTILNRYKMVHEDSTEEIITLEYYPSDDYVQGTALDAENVNPVIVDVNKCTNALGDLKFIACTQQEYEESEQDVNTVYIIPEE